MWCPRQDSNLRTRLRRAVLYPLSYGGLRTMELYQPGQPGQRTRDSLRCPAVSRADLRLLVRLHRLRDVDHLLVVRLRQQTVDHVDAAEVVADHQLAEQDVRLGAGRRVQ